MHSKILVKSCDWFIITLLTQFLISNFCIFLLKKINNFNRLVIPNHCERDFWGLIYSYDNLMVFLFVCLFWGGGSCCVACGILVPQPGIEPGPLAVKAWTLSHWTARVFPPDGILDDSILIYNVWTLRACIRWKRTFTWYLVIVITEYYLANSYTSIHAKYQFKIVVLNGGWRAHITIAWGTFWKYNELH